MKELSSLKGSTRVNGAVLRYTIEGKGVPVLVIGSAIYYPRTFSQQLREGCRLGFMDVRHFAETDDSFSLDRITLDTYTDDIEQVRAAVGFERAVVIGHSHHGNLALEYAKRYPSKVSHIVLLGSPPCDVRGTIEGANEYWASHASEARKAVLRDNWAALSVGKLEAMSPKDAFIARYAADGPKYWYDPTYNASPLWLGVPVNMELVEVFRNFFAHYELSWNPMLLRAPVLVVMGRHDYVVPHVLWDKVMPRLQNVTFRLFNQSGHTPQLEQQTLFDQVFLEWIRKDSPVGAV